MEIRVEARSCEPAEFWRNFGKVGSSLAGGRRWERKGEKEQCFWKASVGSASKQAADRMLNKLGLPRQLLSRARILV